MSPLVRKELRALVPPWLLALALAVLPMWLVWPGPMGLYASNPGYLVEAPFALGILLLCLTPFGQELNWGTFSVLLAQPVSRTRIWRVKTLLLALALLLVFLAFLISNQIRVDGVIETARRTEWYALLNRPGGDRQLELAIAETRHAMLLASLMVGGLGALAGFAGGLWTPLMFRQVSASFWFTLLVPVGLGMLMGFLGNLVTAVVLGLYSAAGFFWARQQFQRVQDTQWTGGIVSLPEWMGATPAVRPAAGRRRRHALRALLRKEWQAQYMNLLLSGGLLVVHLVIIAIRRLSAEYLSAHRLMGMTLESFPILWLVMPLLVGSAAVAEERKLGTFEAVSCLPVSRRRQFGIKLMLTLALGLFLGAVVPAMVESFGKLLGLQTDTSIALGFGVGTSIMRMFTLGFLAAFGISLLSFYGSSLTRNTLQALGAGVLTSVLAALLVEVGDHPPDADSLPLWGTRLLGRVLTPLMACTVMVLAYRNYRRVQVTARVWGRNALVLAAALVAGTGITSAVYHRIWEAWQPIEPSHSWHVIYGPGVVNFGPRGPNLPSAKLHSTQGQIAALLPDGRLWLRQRPVKLRKMVQGTSTTFYITEPNGRWHSGFVPGSNWRDVALSGFGCFATRTDDSLWDLSDWKPGGADAEAKLKRVGDSSDWVKIDSAGWHCSGVKSDGTLWEWGHHWSPEAQPASAESLRMPTQVGVDKDWIAVAESGQSSLAIKADGSVWRWGLVQNWSSNGVTKYETVAQPGKWLAFPSQRQPAFISFNGLAVAAVCKDGTLWSGGHASSPMLDAQSAERARTEMVQWGHDNDWQQVVLTGFRDGIGVKRNGSLYKWDSEYFGWFDPGNSGWRASLTPLSDYHVWIGVCGYRSAYLALGRDGLLCLWGDPERYHYFDRNGPDPERLLLPSRIHAREIANLAP